MQRFKRRKRPNYKRGIVLIILLIVIILLWFNAEDLIRQFLDTKQ